MIRIDMPMPDNCLECRFNTSEFGYCNAMPVEFVGQVSDFEEDGKPEWCPLKAQEPRVMTWQEIVDTAPQMPFIWLESKENNDRVFQSILFKTWLLDSTATIITVMTQGWLFEGYHVDYGRTWRCWTSRPTDEQREATPWEQ